MIVYFRAYDEEFLPIVRATDANIIKYTKLHGYRMAEIFLKSIHAENRVEYFKVTEWKWYEAILDLFENMPETPDWVWFMGADALVMNMNVKLEDIIEKYKTDIIVSSDQAGLSTHSTLFKNTPTTKAYLKHMLSLRDHYENAQYYFQQNPRSFITVVPQNVMNSYDPLARMESPDTPGSYQPGDFIIHFTCMENEKRLELIKVWERTAL